MPLNARPDDLPMRSSSLVVLLHQTMIVLPRSRSLHEGIDQPAVVALVEADGGLIQNVEDAHQPGADLSGELMRSASCWPASPPTVEGEVADTNVGPGKPRRVRDLP